MKGFGPEGAIRGINHTRQRTGCAVHQFQNSENGKRLGLLWLPSRSISCPLLAYLVLTTVHARPELALP